MLRTLTLGEAAFFIFILGGTIMKTVKYNFCVGKMQEFKVEDYWAEYIQELNRQEYNNDHAETRRHTSYCENQHNIATEYQLVENLVINREVKQLIGNILEKLEPTQRKLIEKIYLENISLREIAHILGVSEAAISHRRDRALAKLRKYFDKGVNF